MGTRLAPQALQALLFSLGRRTPVRGPAKLAWEVTERCNARCLTCARREARVDELGTDEGISLVRQAAAMGVLTLSFSGGEPLLRPDLPLLIAEASRCGLHTSVSTNGLLLRPKVVESLVASGLGTIYLSLDGMEATHDRMRGVPGAFRAVTAVARSLAGRGRPRVFYNATISRENLGDLEALAAQTIEDGVDGLTLQPAQVAREVGLGPDASLVLSPDDARALRDTLSRIRRRLGPLIPLPPRYLDAMPDYVRDPRLAQRVPCVAGYLHAVVGSTGEVFPCPVEFASLGSLRRSTLEEIWWGAPAREIRGRIARGDHPPCWFNCVVPASLALHRLLPFGWVRLLGSPTPRHLLRRLRGAAR